jgi:hypothetical protein
VDLERCYEHLADIAAAQGIAPIETLSEEETTAVLDLARVVAHSVERKAAPLVCFSLGRALADVDADARMARIRNVISSIETVANETSPDA